jgi:hypothetical protein
MFALIAVLLAADVPPVDDLVMCVDMTADVSTALQQSVESIGGYCSLSGCRMSGAINIYKTGQSTSNPALILGANATLHDQRVICFDWPACTYSLSQDTNTTVMSVGGAQVFQLAGGTSARFQGAALYLTGVASGPAISVATGAQNYIQLNGVAGASLPTCNASAKGSLHFDTTKGTTVQCTDFGSGTYGWGMTSVGTAGGYSSLTGASAHTVASLTMAANVRPLTMDFTANVAGTGAGTFTVSVVDASTGPTTLCTSGTTTCAGAGVIHFDGRTSCTTSLSGAGGNLVMNVNCAGCTTCPQGSGTFTYY